MNSNYCEPKATQQELESMLANQRQFSLRGSNLPPELRHLLFLAQRWGIYDDVLQSELLRRASNTSLQDLIDNIDPVYSKLDEWLAGPEADQSPMSDEYIAFTKLRIAVDLAHKILRHR